MNSDLHRIAIVGASGLKGKEVKEVLEESALAASDIRLLDDEESLGQLDAVGDEPTFIQNVQPEQFQGVDLAFFASEEEFTRRHWRMATNAGCSVVDLSYALEGQEGVSVRAPWLERERAGHAPELDIRDAAVVSAHPAAVVLALLVTRAARAGALARPPVVTVLEPASEHGRRGMDELHQQTVNLLSFQQMPTAVFDAQIAFNLLARYGEQSTPTLESVEQRIVRHYRLIADGEPVPSLMLAQAPVFHGHVFSIYIELTKPVAEGDFAQALAGEHVEVARLAADSPSNVAAAGQENIMVAVRRDAQHTNGFWIWAAADNFRIAALTAVDCAASLMAVRSKGPVQ